MECDTVDKVSNWGLGRLGMTPNLVPLWPEANYYISAKDKKVRSFSNIKQHDLTTPSLHTYDLSPKLNAQEILN